LRRRAPLTVWAFIGVATALYGGADLHDPPIFFGGLVAVYTVASLTSRRTSYSAGLATAVAVLVTTVASDDTAFVTLALNLVVFGTAWILGDSVRVHRAYTLEVEKRAERLERERADEARRAAAAERVRLARELHDVVAHHVSVIALQSQAAEVLLRAEPDRAAESVEAIGVTAREALSELRRLLGALREADDGAPALEPQPGLGDLDALAESVRHAGVTVELSVTGKRRPLPSGVQLSAYRIVQEALTNVLKHARATTARVALRYEADALVISITDDGVASRTGPPGDGSGQGQGLIGMRERVALFDGELRAGASVDGGFSVDARLPLVDR
ncbi:MAG TPA: sensor histidine kinase, partial [Acidimicrobiales bacterium]